MSGRGKVTKVLALLSAAGLAAGVAAASSGGHSGAVSAGSRAASRVSVKLVEFKVIPVPKRAPAGKVAFVVRNAGRLPHEFVVLKTSRAARKLPVKGSRAVEVGRVGETGTLKPGATRTLTLSLKPGHYVLLCNLPGHYKLGQFVDFTVAAAGSAQSALVKAGDQLYHKGPPGVGYGCARCHGLAAMGGIGPKIVGANAVTIKRALGTVPVMQAFTNLTDKQIDAIAAYLQSLKK